MDAISLMLIYLEDTQEGHKTQPLIKNTIQYFITNGVSLFTFFNKIVIIKANFKIA